MMFFLKRLCYNVPMTRKAFRAGFTLVELSLSMAFISVLSLAIMVIILNTVSSYRRGIVLSQVNSIGTEIVKDIQSSIKNSSAQTLVSQCESLWSEDNSSFTACSNNKGKSFVSVWKEANVVVDESKPDAMESVPVYGALCTGSYSYVWNSGYLFLEANSSIPKAVLRDEAGNRLELMGAHTGTAGDLEDGFKLVKVLDSSRKVCESAVVDGKTIGERYVTMPANVEPTFRVRDAGNENPPVVLLDANNDLALYELNTATPVSDDKNDILFYSVSFILGTVRGGPDIRARGRSCKAPDESSLSDLDYCAINKFNFAAQATGG